MLKNRVKKLYIYRHALWDMAVGQFKARYAGSKLGIWWAVITPLILAASINFVFVAVFKINTPHYTFFVLAGIIPWFFFTNALTEAMNSFLTGGSLLKQAILPPEFIPISSVLSSLFNFLIGFIFLLPLFIIINFKVIQFLPLLFLVIMFYLLFIVGLGLLLSSLNVLFKDLAHFLSITFMIWFWITPVFYSLDMVPSPFQRICLFNPMTHYIVLYQDILFNAKVPALTNIFGAFLFSLGSISIGYFVFLRKELKFLKRI